MTAHLRSMPLVSPEYFARRWPERYAAGLIFYIGFLGGAPGQPRHRASSATWCGP